MKFREAVEILNVKYGYIDVENDEDYTKKEIIEIAKSKEQEE